MEKKLEGCGVAADATHQKQKQKLRKAAAATNLTSAALKNQKAAAADVAAAEKMTKSMRLLTSLLTTDKSLAA